MRGGGGDGDILTIKGGSEWGVRFMPAPAKVHQIAVVRINTHAGCRERFHQGFQRLLEKVHICFQVVGNCVQSVIVHVSPEAYRKIVCVRFVENRVLVEGLERYGRINARENRGDRRALWNTYVLWVRISDMIVDLHPDKAASEE